MSLFNKDPNRSYTQLALSLEGELRMALQPIFDKYSKQGVSLREVFYCVVQAAQDVQLEGLLKLEQSKAPKCCVCKVLIPEGLHANPSVFGGHFDFGRNDPRQIEAPPGSYWCEACGKYFVPDC